MKLELRPGRPYVIAELGTSCDGSVGNMIELAKHAVAAGASAIKVQDHGFQKVSADAQFPPWFQGSRWETRQNYLARQSRFVADETDYENGWDACALMKKHGPLVPLIVSPFDAYAVEEGIREGKHVDAWKIASGQVTNHALIRACVETGLPIIVSSGMTTRQEFEAAMMHIPDAQRWCAMACTSDYPTQPESVWFFNDFDARDQYAEHIGFSDHAPPDSAAAAIVAWTRGAGVFERHVCFDQRMYGSDAKNACTLEQFARYCRELDFAARIPEGDVREENVKRLGAVRDQFLVRSE